MKLRPIIAHRGFSDLYPENTMLAFQKAIERGIRCIETDVTILKDQTPVLFHDFRTDDHTDFKGIIHDLSNDDLSIVDAGLWKDKLFKGTKIPHLEELLHLIKKHHIILNLELKGEAGQNEEYWDKIVDIAVDTVHRCDVADLVFYSSFEFPMLRRLKQQDPHAEFGILLWEDVSHWKEIADELQPQAMHLYDQTISQELINAIKKEHYEIYVYTVNELQQYEMLQKMGIDGIFTDKIQIFDKEKY